MTDTPDKKPVQPGPLLCGGTTDPKKLGGAIAAKVRKGEECVIHAIGVPAINNAAKAVIHARSYVISGGVDLAIIPSFMETVVNGEERTGLRFTVKTLST